MAFRFGLNTVLKHRTRLEEFAQREYAEAQAAVDQCLGEIEAMYLRLDEVREDIAREQSTGGAANIEFVREMEHFIDGQKIRIDRLRLKARELLIVAEEKQEALIEAAREKKILLKLKEKKFAEYRAWLDQLEAKDLDDLTMMRSARGKR